MNQISIKQVTFKQLMILLRRNVALLTLSSCQHQEKHKENQAQSLHVWATKAFRHCCGQADPAFILHLNHGGGVHCACSIITIISIPEWGQSEGLRSGLFIHLIQHLQRPVNLQLVFDLELPKFFNFVEPFIVHVYFIFRPLNMSHWPIKIYEISSVLYFLLGLDRSFNTNHNFAFRTTKLYFRSYIYRCRAGYFCF